MQIQGQVYAQINTWVFLREDVILFLKNQIAKDTDQRRRQRASISHTAVSVDPPVKNRRKSLPVLPTVPGLGHITLTRDELPNRYLAGWRSAATFGDSDDQ